MEGEETVEIRQCFLPLMYQGPRQSVFTKHESVEASSEWYSTFFADERMKAFFDELEAMGKEDGIPHFDDWFDSFHLVIE